MRSTQFRTLGKILHLPPPALQASSSQILHFFQDEVDFLLRLKYGLIYKFLVGSVRNSVFYFT